MTTNGVYLPLFECDKIKKKYIYATFTYEQLAILGGET